MNKIQTNSNDVFRTVLDNGLTVVLKEDHRASVVALQMWVQAGSVTEGEYAGTGISHFVEHMLFKGTARRGVGQIAQEIQSAGGEINAHTSYENTVYAISIESGKFATALEILADAIMHSSFDSQEFSRERDVILKEINMNEDDPERFLSRLFWATAYQEYPARHPVIGYETLFRSLTREDLLRYYKSRYVPNNMTLVIVGDFSIADARAKIEALFKDFSRTVWTPPVLACEPRQLGARSASVNRDVGQAYLVVGFHGPALDDPDMPALDVLSIILGEGRSSRLYQEAREKKALVSSISTWSYTPSFPGVFAISASLDPGKREALESLIWKEIQRLKNEPVRREELEKAKAQTIGEYCFSLETMSGQASDLGSSETTAHDVNFSRRYIDRVERVSAQDIQRVAAKYFEPDLQTSVLLLPKSVDALKTQPGQSPRKEPRIIRQVLPNGVCVLVREEHSVGVMTLKVLLNGGLLSENAKNNGISNLFSEMLIQGTQSRSAEDIVSELETAGGAISNYSGSNSLGFSIDILSKNWPLAVEIAADILGHPSFPDAELAKERQAILLNIRSLEDQVLQTASKLFRQTMFEGHPYQFVTLGTRESVSGLRREDLQNYYKDRVSGPNIVVTVYGDVDSEKVLEALRKALARLPAAARPLPKVPPSVLSSPKSVSKLQEGKQAMVLLGFPGVNLFHPDRAVFEVMEAIFSGQGARIFKTVREKKGLAYLAGCYQISGVDPGAFVFYVGTVPESVDVVVKELFQEIGKIKTEGVDAEELERAKRGLIGARKIHLQTNSQMAMQTGLDELYGLGFGDYKKYYERITAVSEEDLRRVANQYFDDNRYVLTLVTPPGTTADKKEVVDTGDSGAGSR